MAKAGQKRTLKGPAVLNRDYDRPGNTSLRATRRKRNIRTTPSRGDVITSGAPEAHFPNYRAILHSIAKLVKRIY